MSDAHPNIELLEIMVHHLGNLRDRLVFVGGATTGLLITDPASSIVRVTKDVDVIVEVASLAKYYELHEPLKQRGFREDIELTIRWRKDGLVLDVMPTTDVGVGFENRWYPIAVEHAEFRKLPSGVMIKAVSAPSFIATKLEAFHGRGQGDYGASHDIEDVVAVVDGRPELVAEIEQGPSDVRDYIQHEFDDLLADPNFIDSLNWHLLPDTASQARVPEIIRRLRTIAGF